MNKDKLEFTLGKKFNEFLDLFAELAEAGKKYPTKVLYGFHWANGGGTYLEWLLKEFYDFVFDYVIDDEIISYGFPVYRKNLFDYINPDETIVFVATNNDVKFLEEKGYQLNKNILFVNEQLQIERIGFYEWMEATLGLDLIGRETGADINEICKDALTYSISRGMSFPMVCDYMARYFSGASVLDIGCGKGGAMIVMKDFGFQIVDGVELSSALCRVAEQNMQKADCDCKVIEADATLYDNIDGYTLFYIYDSFRGETFRKVIDSLERSLERKPREVHLVYANPWEHKKVVEHGVFKLDTRLEGDWFTRMANVYSN